MTFTILEELWFGDMSDESARKAASESLAAQTTRLHGIRSFPASAQRLLQMTEVSDFDVHEVAKVVESDPALTARLLSVVNSAAVGLTRVCRSVPAAITLLGQTQLRRAAFSAAVMMMFDSGDARAKKVLQHSATVGALCRELARTARLVGEEMYTCGLLHDVGKLMFLQSGEANYERLLDGHELGSGTIHVAECERNGFDHAILAGQMLADWHIPEPIPLVIGWHHNLARAANRTDDVGTMVHLVHLADRLASAIETDPSEEFFDQQAREHDAVALGISAALLQGMWARFRTVARSGSRALLGGGGDPDEDELDSKEVPTRQKRQTAKLSSPGVSEAQCAVCGEAAIGSSCPRCGASLCSAHEPGTGPWCSRCEAEFRSGADAGAERTALMIAGLLGVACAVTALLHASHVWNAAGLGSIPLFGLFFGSVAYLAWTRRARRAKFLRRAKRE